MSEVRSEPTTAAQDLDRIRRARVRVAQVAATCLAGDAEHRDPLTGDALPRTLSEVLATVRRNAAVGRHPLPSDGLQQLVEFVLAPLAEVVERPRARIKRSHEMMPLHSVREFDAKCIEWVGRQSGRTIREKFAGKSSVLGVRRDFSPETNENILVAKLLRGLLPKLDERLRALEAGEYEAVDEASQARAEALRECERLCARTLRHTAFGEIDHLRPVRPNNVLLGDRRYLKLWRGWRWLRALDAGEDARAAVAERVFMQALFAATGAAVAARSGVARAESALRVPGGSAADLHRHDIEVASHAERLFRWRPWRAVEFASCDDSTGSTVLTRVALEDDTLVVSRLGSTGCSIGRAADCVLRRVARVSWKPSSGGCEASAIDLMMQIEVDGESSTELPANLESLRALSEQIVISVLGEVPESDTEVLPRAVEFDGCGIDLGTSRPRFALDPEAAVRASEPFSARIAVAAQSGDASSGAEEMLWMPGAPHAAPDCLRRGTMLATLRDFLRRGETMEGTELEGVDCILRRLAKDLELQGAGLSARKVVAVPDSVDEFAQRELRGRLSALLGRSSAWWRSSCLAIGSTPMLGTTDAPLRAGDGLIVLETRGDGLAVVLLEAKYDDALARDLPASKGIHWERRPALAASDVDPSLAERMRRCSWDHVLLEYATRVLEHDATGIQLQGEQLREVARQLVETGVVEQVLATGRTGHVLLGECSGWFIRVPFVRAIAVVVVEEFRAELLGAASALSRDPLVSTTRREIGNGTGRWLLLLSDVPDAGALYDRKSADGDSSATEFAERARREFGARQVVYRSADVDLAVRGAVDIASREAAGLPSVADWLPPLSLEVVRNGGFEEFTVLEPQITAPSYGSRLSRFPVAQPLLLPKGVVGLEFPLFEGRAMRQDRVVRLSSAAFPLSSPREVRLEVRYQHGEAQPYQLVVEPAAGTLPAPIVATIGRPTERRNPVPSYPPERGWEDPWVLQRIGDATLRAHGVRAKFEQLGWRGETLSTEEFKDEFQPMLRVLHANVRSIWSDGRSLATCSAQRREVLERSVALDWLIRLAALDEESAKKLASRVPDHMVRHQFRRWARRILACMHRDQVDRLLPAVLADFELKATSEQIELFGQLVADGTGVRAPCMAQLVASLRSGLAANGKDKMFRSAIVAVGDACWRHRDFAPMLHASAPELVDQYLERASGLLDQFRQQARYDPSMAFKALLPQCVRSVGETMLAFMRLREGEQPPIATRAGSPLLVRLGIAYCSAEREFRELRALHREKLKPLLLRSYLRFDFSRDPALHQTSDLAFVLRHYLNGGSDAMIEIVGRDESDDGG